MVKKEEKFVHILSIIFSGNWFRWSHWFPLLDNMFAMHRETKTSYTCKMIVQNQKTPKIRWLWSSRLSTKPFQINRKLPQQFSSQNLKKNLWKKILGLARVMASNQLTYIFSFLKSRTYLSNNEQVLYGLWSLLLWQLLIH